MYDACVPWPERPKGAKDKSRGPKGLELEVGARRAPKLLVLSYFLHFLFPQNSVKFGRRAWVGLGWATGANN